MNHKLENKKHVSMDDIETRDDLDKLLKEKIQDIEHNKLLLSEKEDIINGLKNKEEHTKT